MRKSAAAVTNFIADLRQKRGRGRRGLAAFGRKIEQRTETAEPMDEFQVAYHPEVQTGRGREGKIGKDSENPRRGVGWRCTTLFFCDKH